MAVVMSERPELAELSRALQTLSKEEVRYMCVHLDVGSTALNETDANYPREALTCKTKYLEALLSCDIRLSWDKLADVLSKRLNKNVLAEEIRKTYCPITDIPTSPSSQSSTGSSSHQDTVFSPRLMDIETPFEMCDTVDQAAELVTTSESPTAMLPTLPYSQKGRRLQSIHMTKKVSGLVKRFRSVVIDAQVFLTQKEMSPSDFYYFKIDLTKLPMLTKYKKLRFLREKRRSIIRAKSIDEIFDILDPYWDHVNYSLLKHIVKKYCNEKVKKQMKRYVHKIHKFERVTSVKDLTTALSGRRQPPHDYRTLDATLRVDARECSLYDVRKVQESITEKASLQPYVALVQGAHASFVVVTISLVYKYVKRSLDRQFLQDVGIIPETLSFNTTRIPRYRPLHIPDISDSPDLWEHKELFSSALPDPPEHNLFSSALPDPPEHNDEELTFTIRKCDLEPEYRESGPQLMRYCEFITQEEGVNIRMLWKSEEVEFNISGLKEGVIAAKQFLHFVFEPLRFRHVSSAPIGRSSSLSSVSSAPIGSLSSVSSTPIGRSSSQCRVSTPPFQLFRQSSLSTCGRASSHGSGHSSVGSHYTR